MKRPDAGGTIAAEMGSFAFLRLAPHFAQGVNNRSEQVKDAKKWAASQRPFPD